MSRLIALVGLLRAYWNRGDEAKAFRKLLKILDQSPRQDNSVRTRRARQLSKSETQQLLADYGSGMLVREIAAKFGIHRITVTNLVNVAGAPVRFRGLEPRAIKEASRLYKEEGWSLARLAKRYDVTPMTVRHYLLKGNVKMRLRPGWKGN